MCHLPGDEEEPWLDKALKDPKFRRIYRQESIKTEIMEIVWRVRLWIREKLTHPA